MHFALQRLNIMPSQWARISRRERALIIASIDLVIKEEEKAKDSIKRR